MLRYLIKAEARGDKDGRARHRLKVQDDYRGVCGWRLLELMLASCKYKVSVVEFDYGVGKALAHARAGGSLYPSNSPSSV